MGDILSADGGTSAIIAIMLVVLALFAVLIHCSQSRFVGLNALSGISFISQSV